MSYKLLENTWTGIKRYDISGKIASTEVIERYEAPVVMSWSDWQKYVASGNNLILGSGGVITGGTYGGNWLSGAVYSGHVNQGYGRY